MGSIELTVSSMLLFLLAILLLFIIHTYVVIRAMQGRALIEKEKELLEIPEEEDEPEMQPESIDHYNIQG